VWFRMLLHVSQQSFTPFRSQTRDRTSALLEEHKDAQRQEKAADPARFIPERKRASSPPVGRTQSRLMPSAQDVPLGVVEFKEVQVRAIDPKTLAAVRASRREGLSISTLNISSSSVNTASPAVGAREAAGSPNGAQQLDHSFVNRWRSRCIVAMACAADECGRQGEGSQAVVSTSEVIETAVKAVLAGRGELRLQQVHKSLATICSSPLSPPVFESALLTNALAQTGGAISSLIFESIVDSKSKIGINADIALDLMRTLADEEDSIFASCLQVPKEFWRLCNCSAPLLVRSDPVHASAKLRALFRAIGERLKAADPQYCAGLFNDYCLPKIALTLRTQPSMRVALLELCNAYVVPEMRLQVCNRSTCRRASKLCRHIFGSRCSRSYSVSSATRVHSPCVLQSTCRCVICFCFLAALLRASHLSTVSLSLIRVCWSAMNCSISSSSTPPSLWSMLQCPSVSGTAAAG
jgi:hypothetical protein